MKPRIAIPVPHSSDKDYDERALPQYRKAIEQAGGEVEVIPLDKTQDDVAQLLKRCDGVLLPGSPADVDPQKYSAKRDPRTNPADPARDAVDELLLQDAHNMCKPLLGICYGLQALNVWRTGTLVQHLETGVKHTAGPRVKRAHTVSVAPESRLAKILADAPNTELYPSPDFTAMQFRVNSSHHQAAKKAGSGLRVAARCPDDSIIEAVEGTEPDHWLFGVQWHPERTVEEDPCSQALFAALVEAAREWHQSPRAQSEPEGLPPATKFTKPAKGKNK